MSYIVVISNGGDYFGVFGPLYDKKAALKEIKKHTLPGHKIQLLKL